MPVSSSNTPIELAGISRPMAEALFVSSCLLAKVSWYTTQQGMALYLSQWSAFLPSLGVQSALVLVTWPRLAVTPLHGTGKQERIGIISKIAIVMEFASNATLLT